MGHVAGLRSLDESKWLGFEEKLIGNFSELLGIRIPIIYMYISCAQMYNILIIYFRRFWVKVFILKKKKNWVKIIIEHGISLS
jgi:hypothetical protein